ncbi:unnamed protein product [Rhodiola kirilowii]
MDNLSISDDASEFSHPSPPSSLDQTENTSHGENWVHFNDERRLIHLLQNQFRNLGVC